MPLPFKTPLYSFNQDSPDVGVDCALDFPEETLSGAIQEHLKRKKVSFYTPGHKGYSWQKDGSFAPDPLLKEDVSESVPGMDELANPNGVLNDLEKRAAKVWGAEATLISVNGATAGIIAAIIMLSRRGTHLLVPRNCHRSVIHGLILSGLQPIWFEPEWDEEWGFWGEVSVSSLESVIAGTAAEQHVGVDCIDPLNIAGGCNPPLRGNGKDRKTYAETKIAGMVITNPTYAGALTKIESIAAVADKYKIPLLVDEWIGNNKHAALNCGADIVANSLHKTLSCPTQTGLIHLTKKSAEQYEFSASELRACLSLIQSSSPNYFFMSAIDKLVIALSTGKAQEELLRIEKLGLGLQKSLQNRQDINLYQPRSGTIATDILIKHKNLSPHKLQDMFIDRGIFPEAILGQGLLFFLGIGSQQNDIDILLQELDQICAAASDKPNVSSAQDPLNACMSAIKQRPSTIEQVLNPREAFYMSSQVVPVQQALGHISAECLAPWPACWAVLVPGQRIGEEILQFKNVESIRIVKQT